MKVGQEETGDSGFFLRGCESARQEEFKCKKGEVHVGLPGSVGDKVGDSIVIKREM
jgi:hypothetical protein